MEKTGRKKYSICFMTVFVLLFLLLSVSMTAHAVDKNRSGSYRTNYTKTGNKANDMVAIALAQKGANYKSAYDGQPWCSYFVSDVARLAGCSNVIPGDGYCGNVYYSILRAGGQKVTSPRAGDIVFYYCNACSGGCGCGAPWVHIGIMTSSTQSVEGNYGGVVSYPVTSYSHHYGHSTGNGGITRLYLRPNYGGSSDDIKFKQDTKYDAVKGFRGYTCVTGNVELRQSDLATRIGDIYPTDECTVHELYTNGWCKVTCPWNDGGTRTGYTKISNFIQTPTAAIGNYTSSDYINLYSKANLAAQIYRIYPGDKCLTIGTSGSATQVFMPMSGKGYYELGWAKLTSPEVLRRDTRYPVNFKCRILSDSNSAVSAYEYVNSGYVGHVYVDDDCVIQEVYTNGWCKFSCPFYGKIQTVYGKFSDFSACNIEPYSLKAPKYAETWYKSNKAVKVGWVDVGDDITVIAKSGNVSQIIYPADVGKRCGWIDTSALTAQYTVKYDANGGTGTPSSQTAEIGAEITLPVPGSAGPKKTGYTFAGWTDAEGKVLYAGGSRYRGSGNITLYAVWRQNVYYITYVAGSGEDVPEQEQKYGEAIKAAGSPGGMLQQIYVVNGIGECMEEDTVTLERPFLSWNTKEDGTGTTVKAGADYTPNKDVILYAQYKKASFTSETLPKAPDRTGYTFAGWYDAKEGGKKIEAGKEISAELSGIYAHWTAKTYTVTYDANGGEGAPEAQTKTFAEILTLSEDKPTRKGYTFKGWGLNAESAEAVYESGGEYKENKDKTLYAIWDEVKADLDSIIVSRQPNKTTYEYGEELNTEGLELTLTYSDDTTKNVASGYTVSGYDSKKAGEQTLTVAYGGKTASFDVTVKEQPEDKIAVVTFGNVIKAAPGEEIQMDIQLTKNPGFSFMMLRLSYDTEALEFVGAENKTEGNHLFVTEDVIMWDSGKDVTVGAATQVSMGTAVFRVKPGISLTNGQAQTNVGIESLSCYNEKEQEVALKAVEGTVFVDTVEYGDVNRDGEINDGDVQAIREIVAKESEYQKEADVNGDGIIDGRDIIRLNQYLADNSVKLGYDPSKAIGSNGEAVFNNDIKLSVADVSEVKDNMVTMKIMMDENPGVASLSIYMNYDQDAMELVGAENGTVVSGTLAQDEEDKALLTWTTDTVSKATGTLASLTFRLKDGTEVGGYPVAAIVSECYDGSEKSHFGMSAESYILVPMGEVAAEKIELDQTQLALEGGEAAELTANVTPLDATDKTVIWKSSDEKVAAVSGDGQVRALKKGTAMVKASIQGKMAKCAVTVTSDAPEDDRINILAPDDTKKEDVPATNVTYKLSSETSSSKIAAGKKVKMKLTDSDGRTLDNSKITWTSSNSKVASVDSKGIVRFKKKTGGKKVVITAVMKDGSGQSWKFTLRSMKGSVKSVKISGKKSVKAGKSIKLKAVVKTTKGSANKKVIWTSSNTKLAKVSSSGKVTAVKGAKGKVKITAKATDGSGKKKTVTIRVK